MVTSEISFREASGTHILVTNKVFKVPFANHDGAKEKNCEKSFKTDTFFGVPSEGTAGHFQER